MQIATANHHLHIRDCHQLNTLSKQVGWDTDYAQLDPGELNGAFDFGLSGTLRIGCPANGQALIVRGTPPKDCVALILPESPGEKGLFQGQAFGRGQAAIMCPNSEALYRIPQNNRFVSVCIPNWRLRPAVETMTDQSLDTLLASTRVAPLEAGVLSQLHRQMQQAMALSAQAATEASTQALAEIEQYLIGALALALTAPDEAIPRRINQRRQVFLRARDYIHGNLAAPLGLEILALETGVSLRTLRNSFQQVLGISPLHYIKLRRLNAARRLLLAGYPGELSVTEAAMRCGFSHMSYFARDYRELFGESPAQTLAGSTKGVRS